MSRYFERSSRSWFLMLCWNRASASSRVISVTPATPGSALIVSPSRSIAIGVASTFMFTWTSTFDSVKSRAESSPVWRIQKPARSSSIRTIVAVAASDISALRQKPCQARRRLKTTNADHRLSRPGGTRHRPRRG